MDKYSENKILKNMVVLPVVWWWSFFGPGCLWCENSFPSTCGCCCSFIHGPTNGIAVISIKTVQHSWEWILRTSQYIVEKLPVLSLTESQQVPEQMVVEWVVEVPAALDPLACLFFDVVVLFSTADEHERRLFEGQGCRHILSWPYERRHSNAETSCSTTCHG